MLPPMHPARTLIQRQVRRLFGSDPSAPPPPLSTSTDPGLFGPDSAAWRVHGDFTSMMIGGVSALLLQMLHPGALAGVWDFSDFRADMAGRLRRTANFVAGTTYGPTEEAEALIAHVQSIHDRVHGLLPDGTPYDANDPDLLTWVHVAEVSCFLKAWLRYRDGSFPRAEQDRYFAETAVVARRLGARDVPVTRAAVDAYLERMRPQLLYDHRTAEVAAAVLSQKPSSPAAAPFMAVVFQAAKDLLPPWAARMHGFEVAPAGAPALRLGAGVMGVMMRWALTEGAETRARRRLGAAAG